VGTRTSDRAQIALAGTRPEDFWMSSSSTAAGEPFPPPPPSAESLPLPARMSSRLRRWLRALQRNPSLEEKTMRARREQLLEDLNRAVSEAPDDMPIKSIVERLNRHRDD